MSTGEPTPSRPRVRKDPGHGPDARPPHFLDFEQAMHRHLGTSVAVRARSAERGQIVIDYHSREEFDRLSRFFGVEVGAAETTSQLSAPGDS